MEDTGHWQGGWLKHIQDYSSRKLTVPDDKLTALSGVAQMIAINTKDTYYAGLWKSHLPEDLAWRVYPRDESRALVEEGFAHETFGDVYPVIVPSHYRAPSWSWASLDARILFVHLDYGNLVADILRCHVDECSPFGKVSGGWIKIWGPVFEISACPAGTKTDPKDPLGFGLLVQFQLDAGITQDEKLHDGISYGEAFFDVAPSFPTYALFLDPSNALLLQRSEQNYKRVGLAKFLRTAKQRLLEPLIDPLDIAFRREHIPYGPISCTDACMTVTII
ncbi:HET-domain-containing protein [Penicillium angulare]|uniref:HET-domain-containing protein n=1 Tax=Penicillium angulare TaxID=116970 RepID=A0A9W9ETV1_9EURO|nr:HET-domain-containing protein [Penicillium angulare]